MKYRALFLLCLIFLPLFSCCAEKTPSPAPASYVNELYYDLAREKGVLDLVMFRVGQADALLLSTQNHTILLDTGERNDEDADKILAYLAAQNIECLDAVIVSDLLTDSIGGLERILGELPVAAVYAPAYNATGHRHTKFYRNVIAGGAALSLVKEETSLTFDDLTLCLIPAENPLIYRTEEDMALVVSAVHGENTFLFTAEIGETRIAELTERIRDPYSVVKLPDHGVFFNGIGDFLDQYRPKTVLISDSAANGASYELLSLLADRGIYYYRTHDASVCIRSDGTALNILQN